MEPTIWFRFRFPIDNRGSRPNTGFEPLFYFDPNERELTERGKQKNAKVMEPNKMLGHSRPSKHSLLLNDQHAHIVLH